MLARFIDLFQPSAEEASDNTLAEDKRRLACAALMIEVAIIDQEFDERELESLKQTLQNKLDVSAEDVDSLIVLAQNECNESTSLYEFTSMVNQSCSHAEKYELLLGMWQIAFADGDLDKYEEYIIRKVADLLYLAHGDFIRAKHQARASFKSE